MRRQGQGVQLINKVMMMRTGGVGLVILLLFLGINSGYADGWLPQESPNADDDTSAAPNRITSTDAVLQDYMVNERFDALPADQQTEAAKAAIVEQVQKELADDKKKKFRVLGKRLGGIVNTRHNLTMSYNQAGNIMNSFRNNYYQVCVYCHTPHGANSTVGAPLWNRTVLPKDYKLYTQSTSVKYNASGLDLNYSQPGPNSLTCLSCHDGATAIDSIINMPTQLAGAFRAGYSKAQETKVNPDFLDQWSGNKINQDPEFAGLNEAASPADTNTGNEGHMGFNSKFVSGSAGTQGECITCHNPQGTGPFNAPDFRIFSIGDNFGSASSVAVNKDGSYLVDDHPIGVEYPKEFGDNVDYNEPDVKQAKIAFFDLNGNQHADPNEIRLYNTGEGYEVECGSCHDPHGIKVEGGDELIPSFLRVGEIRVDESFNPGSSFQSANVGSKLCLTCHVK